MILILISLSHTTRHSHTLTQQSKANQSKAKPNKQIHIHIHTLNLQFTIESNGLGWLLSLTLARSPSLSIESIWMNERCVYVRFCTTDSLNMWTMQILCTSSSSFVSFCMRIRSMPLNHTHFINNKKRVTFVPIVISDFAGINLFDVTFISINCAPYSDCYHCQHYLQPIHFYQHAHAHMHTLNRVPLFDCNRWTGFWCKKTTTAKDVLKVYRFRCRTLCTSSSFACIFKR